MNNDLAADAVHVRGANGKLDCRLMLEKSSNLHQAYIVHKQQGYDYIVRKQQRYYQQTFSQAPSTS